MRAVHEKQRASSSRTVTLSTPALAGGIRQQADRKPTASRHGCLQLASEDRHQAGAEPRDVLEARAELRVGGSAGSPTKRPISRKSSSVFSFSVGSGGG